MILVLIVILFIAWLLFGTSQAIVSWLFWLVVILLLVWAAVTVARMIQNNTKL